MKLRTRSHRMPWMTLSLCAATLLIAAIPGAAEAMHFDRTAVAAGQWWRIFTGHLTHWNSDHLVWDLLTFAALGTLCERQSRGRMAACVAVASVMICGVVWIVLPEIGLYRGLRGVDTALFALFTASQCSGAAAAGRWRAAAMWCVPLLAMGAKLGYETASGQVLFVDAAAAGFEPLAAAHVAGGLAGLAVAATPATIDTRAGAPNRGVS